MTKERINVSIDKELKEKAKKHGINISELLKIALEEELDLIENNRLLRIDNEIKELYDIVDEAERKLEHLNKLRRREHPKTEQEKIAKLWLKLRKETYRRDRGEDESYFEPSFIEECEQVLGYSFRELLVIAIWFKDKHTGRERWDLMLPEYEANEDYNLENSEYILRNVEHCLL